MLGQEASLLAIPGEEIAGQVEDILVTGARRNLDAHRGELEQDGLYGGASIRQPHRAVRLESHCTLELHPAPPTRVNFDRLTQRLTRQPIRQPGRIRPVTGSAYTTGPIGWRAIRETDKFVGTRSRHESRRSVSEPWHEIAANDSRSAGCVPGRDGSAT